MRRILLPALLIALFLSAASISSADSTILYTTPQSAAMGGAFGSIATDNSAIILNPAGMSAQKRYGAHVGYLYTNPDTESRVDFSAVDSYTSQLGVGAEYIKDYYKISSLSVERDTYVTALSMGEPGVFSAGITGRWDQFAHGISGNAESLGYGIIFSPDLPFLNLSVAGLNLTRIKGSREELPPRLIDAGISMFLQGILTISFDAVKNLEISTGKNMDYHAGGEIVLVKQIALRGGYAWMSTVNDKTYSAGFAWDAPRFTLSYTFVGDVMHQSNNVQLVAFTLYPF